MLKILGILIATPALLLTIFLIDLLINQKNVEVKAKKCMPVIEALSGLEKGYEYPSLSNMHQSELADLALDCNYYSNGNAYSIGLRGS